MIAEHERFTRPQDFFRETEVQRAYVDKIRSLENVVFSPVDFINQYGMEVANPPRLLEILLSESPGLIVQFGDEIGIKGKDIDKLINILEFKSQQLMESGVFPDHYTQEVNNIFKLLSEQ